MSVSDAPGGGKAAGAFLTIGEVSTQLGVPQHILRYWETRFPQLRPLQRAGNRRYYRPEDVALARRIHQLLDVEGYTIRGVQQVLAGKAVTAEDGPGHTPVPMSDPAPTPAAGPDREALIRIRDRLAAALERYG